MKNWLKNLLAKIHYKCFAKYQLQDKKHMQCNGDADFSNGYWIFTPATNTAPPVKAWPHRAWLSWKGKRVEIAERKHITYKDDDLLFKSMKFTVLDDEILDKTGYVGIHQMWSGGHLYPKIFVYLQKAKGGGIEVQTRQCSVISNDDPNPKFTYGKAVKIELDREYKLDVEMLIDNVKPNAEPKGYTIVSIDDNEVLNKTCFNSDSKRLIEKFGCYCKTIVEGDYKPMLKVKIKRNWLNVL